ncbi:uncharacterized protein FA14DRAFT_68145 [Meira miltonrushii]|uniref:Uncharacterized protein n=1 Tax=Meira miltonrushii TaxID=1280837 RepID=A0A316V9D2_9BASI|nr:uncharacterized protein FA14DRAFT_68145 [Meira miltonrushii]PWN34062.1 hypothetical protein FA14DRAFT_68145 [Meira miltonrushii]
MFIRVQNEKDFRIVAEMLFFVRYVRRSLFCIHHPVREQLRLKFNRVHLPLRQYLLCVKGGGSPFRFIYLLACVYVLTIKVIASIWRE